MDVDGMAPFDDCAFQGELDADEARKATKKLRGMREFEPLSTLVTRFVWAWSSIS